jgi:NADPH:quinone reductase
LRPGFEDGSYQAPSIARAYPLSDAVAAYRAVEAGTHGRVVLTP